MDKFERVVALHRILNASRYPVKPQTLIDELGCSKATLYRTVAFLRDHLGAPLETDEQYGGFYYDPDLGVYELPGLWLNTEELAGLLMAYQAISSRHRGLLEDSLSPLKGRIEKLLNAPHGGKGNILSHIKVIRANARQVDEKVFGLITLAIMNRQSLDIVYHGRIKDDSSQRSIIPLKLTQYRENWYLDAWCQKADDFRRFAVDRIDKAKLGDEVPEKNWPRMEAEEQGYGIFSTRPVGEALIRFTGSTARWVADETWHDEQSGKWQDDGSYLLTLPYGNARELIMDVMRYGADAEILEPDSLREQAGELLSRAAAIYQSGGD